MTATEVLRRLLDECGVEYEGGERSLRWRDRYGIMMQAFPLANGELGMGVWSCTPEQAIAATLGHSSNCTNGERTNAACKPITYDNGYSTDHLEPGEYHEFWEPACACGNCGELIPMRKFCPNCGSRLEVES